MKPDAYIKVRFKTPEENGRENPVMGAYYSCPMRIGCNEFYDCRLLLEGRKLELGVWSVVPVKFLDWGTVFPKLSVGTRFALWEGREIAEGEIERISELVH